MNLRLPVVLTILLVISACGSDKTESPQIQLEESIPTETVNDQDSQTPDASQGEENTDNSQDDNSSNEDQTGQEPGDEQAEDTNEPLPVIDDIQCSVSYPLSINHIWDEVSQEDLLPLYDGIKTNNSNWQASNLDSSIIIELNQPALLKHLVITWQSLDKSHFFKVHASKDKENWQLISDTNQSQKDKLIPDVIDLANTSFGEVTAAYIKLELIEDELLEPSQLLEVQAFGCFQDVSHDIELIDWYLSVPTDEDDNGKSDSIKETDLSAGYFDPRFFSLSEDGGLIFSTSVSGYRTSTNTNYVRSELREMLRRGNTSHNTQGVNANNWVFSSAPQTDLNNAGGIDGELHAELAVNHVTTTGEDYQVGRVIIGQIHANDDEPARLYYRKLPNNTHGSIYLAHEILGGDDIYFEIIGSRDNNASNPDDGILLNEKFSYSIVVAGNILTVSVTKSDGQKHTVNVDMSDSGYDEGGQYMYFKAGVYHLNNSGDQHDHVQATFYQITNSHIGYLE